jgi:Acetyltransferase (GNAT) domain
MSKFEVPTITTARLRLRAFRASDLDAYSAMQANPEVMRYMVMGRAAMPAEVWRTMLMSLGSWALRGYGMWACEKIEGDVFIGSAGIFEPQAAPTMGISAAPVIIRCSCSTSLAMWSGAPCARATCIAPPAGEKCWNRWSPATVAL